MPMLQWTVLSLDMHIWLRPIFHQPDVVPPEESRSCAPLPAVTETPLIDDDVKLPPVDCPRRRPLSQAFAVTFVTWTPLFFWLCGVSITPEWPFMQWMPLAVIDV